MLPEPAGEGEGMVTLYLGSFFIFIFQAFKIRCDAKLQLSVPIILNFYIFAKIFNLKN